MPTIPKGPRLESAHELTTKNALLAFTPSPKGNSTIAKGPAAPVSASSHVSLLGSHSLVGWVLTAHCWLVPGGCKGQAGHISRLGTMAKVTAIKDQKIGNSSSASIG